MSNLTKLSNMWCRESIIHCLHNHSLADGLCVSHIFQSWPYLFLSLIMSWLRMSNWQTRKYTLMESTMSSTRKSRLSSFEWALMWSMLASTNSTAWNQKNWNRDLHPSTITLDTEGVSVVNRKLQVLKKMYIQVCFITSYM